MIPAPARGAASTAVWEMRCPLRGYIVAGIDARVSDRAIDVSIRGENGAPVSPGVTTGRAVVFTALYAGGAPRQTSFQPFIGCIPTSGGGGRGETAVRRPAAFAPVKALDRRVVRKRLVSGATVKVVGGCPAGTRLLGTSHAYAFRTEARAGPHAPPRRDRPPRRHGAAGRRDGDGRPDGAAEPRRRAPAAQPLLAGSEMSFEAPALLATLLLVPLAAAGYWLLQRRPPKYAVRYTNLARARRGRGQPPRVAQARSGGVCCSPRSRRSASRSPGRR